MSTPRLEHPSPPAQFTLRSLFVVMTVLALLLGILVPLVSASRDAARTMQCSMNMRQIGFGLLGFESARGSLPPAFTSDLNGYRLHSWRTQLPPYLEQLPIDGSGAAGIYNRICWKEPWDSRNNSELRSWSYRAYGCPADETATTQNETSYMAVIGQETLWRGRTGLRSPKSGIASLKSVLVVESVGHHIPWMEPRDLKLADLKLAPQATGSPLISSEHAKGANVLLADCSVRCLPRNTPAITLQSMLTATSAEPQTGVAAGDGGQK